MKNPPPNLIINPERQPLTAQKYKELSGLHHVSDEEAEAAVHSIQQLAKLLYQFVPLKKCI